mgnify:CR=1 FL=1
MSETKINIGPIHPSTHGVLRLVVTVDGDTIKEVEPHIGFLHRGVEKLAESRMYMQNIVYMEKLDYAAPMAHQELYVSTVEKLLGIEVKERAEYVRVVLLELQRIASHLLWLGTMCNDIGQMFSMFMWTMRDRDMILRLLQEATGQRMFYVNMRLGGVNRDLPAGFEDDTYKVLDSIEHSLGEYKDFLESNPVFMERLKNVGVLSRENAIRLGVTGPVLRGSGIDYDVRRNSSYYKYTKLGFRPAVETGGDSFARYKVRMKEMQESISLVRKALEEMPKGDALGLPIKLIGAVPKEKEAIVKRELPRGEGMMYMVADKQRPYRLAIRAPAFINLAALDHISRGQRLADLFAILGSLDLVMADVDK